MAYEMFRNSMMARLVDKLPPKLLNDVLLEMDLLSDSYSFDKVCTDLITIDGIPDVIKAYIAAIAIENCSELTVYNYTRELLAFFNTVRKSIHQITPSDIRIYLHRGQTERGWQPSTKDHVRTVITGFFNWAVNEGAITKNPASTIKPIRLDKKKLPPLSPLELEKFRNACETLRERAVVDFMYATGCRVSEVAKMTKQDIDWVEKSVFVHLGKGKKDRITYINAEAELSLKKYLNSRTDNDPHLFVSERQPHVGMHRNSFETIIRKVASRLAPGEISIKVTPHTFRRTMGTVAVERGCPIEKVKEILGHESLDTTMRYVTVSKVDVKTAHQKFIQ